MQSCCDLIAEEALYHVNCYHRFTGEKHLQCEYDNTSRPENSSMLSAFNRACDWSESCSEGINRISLYNIIQQIHADELHEKMKSFLLLMNVLSLLMN